MANLTLSTEHSASTAAPPLPDYNTLVGHHYKDLYRYAYWLSDDRARAEDLVQQTFLRAWRSRGSLTSRASTKSWLFTILNLENVRLQQRNSPVTGEPDNPATADESTLDNERNASRPPLQQTILQLPLNYREPLLLQLIGGFTITEIAEILDLELSTVQKSLFRARNRLISTELGTL